jgi:hypothetical protein
LSDGRHSSQPSRIKPAYLIAGGVLVLAVIAVVAVLLARGPDSAAGSASPVVTPKFSFKASDVVAITTAAKPNQKEADQAAKVSMPAAETILHDLYSNGFLVPANWTTGTYDSVLSDFADPAKAQATKQIDVLTAGASAGSTYSSISPETATLTAKVLMDPKDHVYSIAGRVTFTATAVNKDGSGAVLLQSKGQYILQQDGGSWKITAFSVRRDDHPIKTAPSISGAPTPTGGSS